MKLILPILLGVLGIGASAGHAQDSTRVVTGRVVNEATGQPVPMATVHLGPRVAESDSAGVFRLCRLASGAAAVNVLALGFQARVVPVVVGEQDSTTLLVRTQPAVPGESSVVRLGHRPAPGSHRALFVVDGERAFYDPSGCGVPGPGERRVDSLSPEWIESVEVLKGAAAVERFGPAGRDGVVVIVTKQARARTTP